MKKDLLDYWDFKYSLGQYAIDFYSVFRQTGLTFQFDKDANSYSKLFNAQFKSLLEKNGITDIDVQEFVPLIMAGTYTRYSFDRTRQHTRKNFLLRGPPPITSQPLWLKWLIYFS